MHKQFIIAEYNTSEWITDIFWFYNEPLAYNFSDEVLNNSWYTSAISYCIVCYSSSF